MGITAAVSLEWLVLLVGSVSMVSIFLYVINSIVKFASGQSFFTTSFSEGNVLSSLSVTSNSSLKILEDSKYLLSKNIKNSEWTYVLAFSEFNKLKEISDVLEGSEEMITISLRK